MTRRRKQKGSLWKSRGWWFLRYRDYEQQPDGTFKRVQKAEQLAPVSGETRSKQSRVLSAMMAERMAAINGPDQQPVIDRWMNIGQFVETKFLPAVKEHKRDCTYQTALSIWRNHLEPRVGHVKLRDFTIVDGESVLNQIAKEHPELHRSYLGRVKATLGQILAEGRRLGLISTEPMRGVRVPAGRKSESRGHYGLEEIQKMLAALSVDDRHSVVRLAVALAAFSGLRKSEMQGLKWGDYDGPYIHVTRACVCGIMGEPKTRASKAAVPVIQPLRKLLDTARGSPSCDAANQLVFQNGAGEYLHFGHLARLQLVPILKALGIPWRGWHAFRRGLATNLSRLGIAPKTIQAIMRHSNLDVTMNIYVQSVDVDSIAAMGKLEAALAAATVSLVQ